MNLKNGRRNDLKKQFHAIFKKNKAGSLSVQSDHDYVIPLLNYFKGHRF